MDSFKSAGALNLTFAAAADGAVAGDGKVFQGKLEGGNAFYYSPSGEEPDAEVTRGVSDIAEMTFAQIENLTKTIKATSWIEPGTKVKFSGTTDELRALSENFRNKITDIKLSRVEVGFAFDFGQFPNLHTVDLSGCYNLTDATAASLAACQNLHTVNLSECDNLTDAAAASLAACPSLHTVDLRFCPNLTDATAASLAACPNLRL
jgi:hypothetical protein